jgi:hypothetical protein
MAYQRREAIRTMVDFCTAEDNEPERIRARIKAYFDSSEKFSEKLMAMSEGVPRIEPVSEVISLIEGFDDIEHLYWETRRLLDERFRPDWAAISLFAILYRERAVGDSARRLLSEVVTALGEEAQVTDPEEDRFLAGFVSSLRRIDDAYGSGLGAELMRDIVFELYQRHGKRYLAVIEQLDVSQETRDFVSASLAARQLGDLADVSRYPFRVG